jgi:hypothetical protein
MSNWAETARRSDQQSLIEMASILAAGIRRLQERHSLPNAENSEIPRESGPDSLEVSRKTVLSVVHGG